MMSPRKPFILGPKGQGHDSQKHYGVGRTQCVLASSGYRLAYNRKGFRRLLKNYFHRLTELRISLSLDTKMDHFRNTHPSQSRSRHWRN